jgi:hypothetical protein
MGYGLMAAGMARRMGDDSKPPVALTLRQVLWVMSHLDRARHQDSSCHQRRDVAAAAVAHLLGWLGWLRSVELFSLTWGDVTITPPPHGARIGLPSGVGAIELRLLPETKSSRTKVADVVISYLCASGLAPGLWFEHLHCLWPGATGLDPLIRGADGRLWDSRHYRLHYLYPWLYRMQQSEGDPFLQAFTQEAGNRIEDKYYSLGTYHRGGRSACTKRNHGTRRATPEEIYKHGRWRRRISKENMPTRYNEYGLDDRINITLLCM